MVVFSALRPSLLLAAARIPRNGVVQRCMSEHKTFPYMPSRFQWNKFKDLMNFYILLGAIPIGLVILYTNVFIGPATLSEIPEGHVPKYWEYYRHPITRFMARYILPSPQQEYEKYLHYIFEEDERIKIRQLERQVKEKMSERFDYQAYYYRPVLAKYHRISREAAEYLETLRGD